MNNLLENHPLKIQFLGTAGSYPTKDRSVSCIYGRTNAKKFLLDVGENAQKGILQANEDLMVDFIVITHRHIDHVMGLYPLIKTMELLQRKKELKVYVSEGNYYEKIFKMMKINYSSFVSFIPITPGLTYIEGDLELQFFLRDHGTPDMSTYGVNIKSLKKEKYDAKKLDLFSDSEKKDLFDGKKIKLGTKLVELENFILKRGPSINLVYTSDGIWDPSLKRYFEGENKGGVLITECTHYHEEDTIKSLKSKHTHFKDLSADVDFFKKIDLVLVTHLGQRISNEPALKKIKEKHSKLLGSNKFFFVKDYDILYHNNLEKINIFNAQELR